MLLLAVLLVGCGPTVQEQRAARLEALQLELDAALETWKTDVSLRRFPTSAEAARSLASRYDTVYERWGLRADPLTQASMAYALALATRVDAKDLSAEDANALLAKMRGDMDRARSTLSARHAHSPTSRDAAMLAWWKDYWTASQRSYQTTSRNPVRCETTPPEGHGSSVVCN
jgi:uncharacterized membrane-anchored protein YhcB (DUF1043 family)